MFAVCFFGICLGLFVGVIFSLLFVTFDSGWKKTLSTIFTTVASGGGLWGIYKNFNVTDYTLVFISAGAFCLSFLVAFILFLAVMRKIMKDRDDGDILRIRDIILGQKNYIETYYKKREKEIDDKLNVPALEKRETDISRKEQLYDAKLEILKRERDDFEKLTEGKLKIKLPENKNLIVSKEFLDLFPSYVENLGTFIQGIRAETELFFNSHVNSEDNKKTPVDYKEFRVYLTLLSIQILEQLFGKNANDVRVHFRYYDIVKSGYKKLTSVIASKESRRDLTFIPCDKANMIIKSFECRRALIKSHNIDYDYDGINSTTWTEYMTGAFYNITKDGKPCISFGISVKNATKYKHLFNFLNYCKFESYLQEVLERFNDEYPIATILYSNHTM